jgi:hypothetical protein
MAKDVNDAELIQQAESIIKQKAGSRSIYPVAASLCGDFTENNVLEATDEAELQLAGYYLLDKFRISSRAICHFLRKVENEYPTRVINPYHNNIHASDVIQTTHALIQFGGADLIHAYSPLEIFATLMAAALHDMGHPGTNNNYQINKQTELAEVYNDLSVLENMHASRASKLLKEAGGGLDNDDANEGIFGNMSQKDRVQVRTGIIRSILSTDMSHHFKSVAKMKGYIKEVIGEIESEKGELPQSDVSSVLQRVNKSEHSKLKEMLLPFMLHLADISNPAKPPGVSIEWSNSAYNEFFQQGDLEASEGMPISPLCDRTTTYPPEGQIGFITYVVRPAFLALEQCLPEIGCVIAQVSSNASLIRRIQFN